MLLRLSRISFWLAAIGSALALLSPLGATSVLTACSSFACLMAVGLWRASAREAARELHRGAEAPEPLTIEASALLDATSTLVGAIADAGTAPQALHGAARVLRNELGASRAVVYAIHEQRGDEAWAQELDDSQPAVQVRPRWVRMGKISLLALQTGRSEGAAPGELAIPVHRHGQIVSLVLLEGIDLGVDARALAGVLELTRGSLSRRMDELAALAETAAAQSKEHAGANPDELAPFEGQARVLLLEDNTAQTQGFVRMLRGLRCEVTQTAVLTDGLNAFRHTQFDIVLVDLRHFGTSAASSFGSLRSPEEKGPPDSAARRTPVVALSDSPLPGDREHALEQGFDDHLCKPVRRHLLLAMLNRHIQTDARAITSSGAEPAGATAGVGASGSAASLDPAALARLAELDPTGQNRLIERVLHAFQGSVERLRRQLDAARGTDDHSVVKLVAHTLKSSSASIGALRLSQICAEVELGIRTDPSCQLSPMLVSMDQALDEALAAIEIFLKERA